MAKTRTYTPGDGSLIVHGVPISGWTEVNLTYPNEKNTKSFDTSGGVTFSQNKNYNFAEMTIIMEQGASDNLILTGLIKNDALLPTVFKDNSGNSLHVLGQSKFMGLPDAGYAQESGTREWTVMGYDETAAIGGN